MVEMANDGPSPHFPFLHFGLAAPQPLRRHHAQSLLGPSFHPRRLHHVLKSHPQQAAIRRDDEWWHAVGSHSATAPPSCSLQPLLKLSLLSLRPSLLQFSSIATPLLNHGNLIFKPVCVFLPFPLLPLLFWEKWTWAFSPCLQIGCYHHNYFFLIIVCWQYQKYSTILVLVLCLLCVTLLVCSSYSSFAPRSPFFNSWWQQDCEWFTHILVLLIDVAFITS